MDIVDFNRIQPTTNNLAQKRNLALIDMAGVNIPEELLSETHEHILTDQYRFVAIENHEIDYELIEKTGLGVATSNHDTSVKLLYNPNKQDSIDDETIRFGVYYQLTHMQFDDKQLEKLLLQDVTGKVFMEIVFGENMYELYNRLKRVFDSKKNNVISLGERR